MAGENRDMTKRRFDFDEIIDRRGTDTEKWHRYEGRDVIPLWLADMDFRSPPAVMEALHRRVDHGVFGYTTAPKELTEAVMEHVADRFGWAVDAEWILWLPGVVTGLNAACRAVGGPGDEVITAVPIYPPFLTAPANGGRRAVRVPLVRERGRWVFDMARLEAAMGPSTRLLLLCSPHNPVGRAFDRSELEALAALCEKRNVVICSDEIHNGLILEEGVGHVPTAALDPVVAARTITLMSPSKTFNIPGLYCSFAVIPDPVLRSAFREAMAGIVPHVNIMGYVAALAAYREGREWHEALISYLRANRDFLEGAIARIPGLSMTHVEATYLAWIDGSATGIADPARFFEEHGVGLGPGSIFGGEKTSMRLSFGCPRTILEQALDRIRAALTSLP